MKIKPAGRKPKTPQRLFDTNGITWEAIGFDIWTAEARKFLSRNNRFKRWADQADLIVGRLMSPYLLRGDSPEREELALRFARLLAEDAPIFLEMSYMLSKRITAWRSSPEMRATVALAWLQNFQELKPATRLDLEKRLDIAPDSWKGSAKELIATFKRLDLGNFSPRTVEHARKRLRDY